MIRVTRQYINPETGEVVEIPLTFTGYVDDRIIEQYYIEEVKSRPSVKVIWKWFGKELCT